MKASIYLMLIAVVQLPLAANAGPITIGEVEWRQVTETTGLSWYEVASVCDEGSGECSGALGEINFDGWTWASVADIGDMFRGLTGHPGSGQSFYSEYYSSWAPAFLSMFDATQTGSFSGIYGWARDFDNDTGFRPYIADTSTRDYISTSTRAGAGYGGDSAGAWLYRPAAVPEPATLCIVMLGASCMMYARRRRTVPVRA